jgi:hypothetical protein
MEHAFSGSIPRLSRRDVLILALAALLGACIYLGASALTYRVGFPLDDSWIHLTYARNLAERGEWSFQPGELSAGSTAPLWTLLLSLGFWLRLGPYVWTYLLGEAVLVAIAVVGERTVRRLSASYRPRLPWIGLFFVAEWHLQWAALSGMETLLQALLVTAVLALLMTGTRRYIVLGILTGVSVWVRPDGLTLIGPVVFTILLTEGTVRGRGSALARYAIGLGALLLPYLAFNLWLSDTPMPNTFYAKQAEYAAWQARSLLYRLATLLVQLLTGPSVVLLPGAVATAVLALRRRQWAVVAAILWCVGYLLLYILRLPAYQHGRYLMPAMPVFFLFGLLAFVEFQGSSLLAGNRWRVQRVWALSLLAVTIGFVGLGAQAYAQDVGLIESEMVVTAKWVSRNLPPNAVVAAHDIGALGYFDNHKLIDLAGLVSPEVIPFIRDEARLSDFLTQQHANYLVAFPSFYPVLAASAEPVFTSGGRFAPAMDEPNMTVYAWPKP